jgi:hypothetical protein
MGTNSSGFAVFLFERTLGLSQECAIVSDERTGNPCATDSTPTGSMLYSAFGRSSDAALQVVQVSVQRCADSGHGVRAPAHLHRPGFMTPGRLRTLDVHCIYQDRL